MGMTNKILRLSQELKKEIANVWTIGGVSSDSCIVVTYPKEDTTNPFDSVQPEIYTEAPYMNAWADKIIIQSATCSILITQKRYHAFSVHLGQGYDPYIKYRQPGDTGVSYDDIDARNDRVDATLDLPISSWKDGQFPIEVIQEALELCKIMIERTKTEIEIIIPI